MDWRDALSPRLGHTGPNWVNKAWCICSFSFIAYPYCWLCLWCCSTLGFRGVCCCCCLRLLSIDYHYLLLHTSLYFSLVWFFIRIHNILRNFSLQFNVKDTWRCWGVCIIIILFFLNKSKWMILTKPHRSFQHKACQKDYQKYNQSNEKQQNSASRYPNTLEGSTTTFKYKK